MDGFMMKDKKFPRIAVHKGQLTGKQSLPTKKERSTKPSGIKQAKPRRSRAERTSEYSQIATQETRKIVVADYPPEQVPCLLVMSGVDLGKLYPMDLIEGPFRLGRNPENHMRIDDFDISRYHAEIRMTPSGHILLEDLGSTNGLFVNGDPVGSHRLKIGDRVRLGPHLTFQFSFKDQHEVSYHQKIYNRIAYDSLTGVVNRRYFLDATKREWSFAKRHGQPLCVALFDIDRFKNINDTYGHPVGDEVLMEFSHRVKEMTRDEDLFARYGGEEFVLLLRSTKLAGAQIVCERIRDAIQSAPFSTKAGPIDVTVSGGLLECLSEALPFFELDGAIQIADECLYHAKESGRNRIKCTTLTNHVPL